VGDGTPRFGAGAATTAVSATVIRPDLEENLVQHKALNGLFVAVPLEELEAIECFFLEALNCLLTSSLFGHRYWKRSWKPRWLLDHLKLE
jgi:hypothetical protein